MRLLCTDDRDKWRAELAQMPVHDVHCMPEMMLPYEATRRGRGMLLIDENEHGVAAMPILRMDNGEIRHPFNFGGPMSTPDYKGFPKLRGPLYCTLNPFYSEQQMAALGEGATYAKDTVWVDLTQPTKLRATTRHCVEKAAREQVEFIEAEGPFGIRAFSDMYHATMRRNNAAPHWMFQTEWFSTLLRSLSQNATLFLVMYKGEPEAGCILLRGWGTCYYHFAASFNQYPQLGLNHFMVVKAMEWAKEKGCTRLHLGGGVEPNDGLFRFKAGFSDLRLPVYKFTQMSEWSGSKCHAA